MNSNFSYPKWEEIPNIDLYLDQVFALCQSGLCPISPDKRQGTNSIHGQ